MNAVGGGDDEANRRRNQASEEVYKVSYKGQAKQKKPRFIWTIDVHNCFLDAVKQIGFHRAVPTKILELMNVEGLTRENVASHLQKHRLHVKRKEQDRARAHTAAENVSKGVYSHMSAIPQQPLILPNTMQGIDMGSACLDWSQLAPSLPNHDLNMIRAFPTDQDVYGMPFKDLFDEGVNRMSSARLVHGLYDSNGPRDINKIECNYGPLPPKPLVDPHGHNLMDPHDTTFVPLYDRLDELSRQDIFSPFVPQYDQRDEVYLQGIISPSFVSEYDQLDELIVADQGNISPSFAPRYDQHDELFVADQGISSPSFVPQYDRRDELFVADQGIISPLLAQNMEGLGVGMTRLPESVEGLIRMKVEGFGLGIPPPPTGVLGMKFTGLGQGCPHLPEATGSIAGMKFEGLGQGCPHLPEATGSIAGMKFEGLGHGCPHLPEATGSIAGMKFEGHVPCLPEATGCLTGMKVEGLGADATHLPEATGGPGLGVPQPPEATGGLTGMNDFQQVLPFNEEEYQLLASLIFV